MKPQMSVIMAVYNESKLQLDKSIGSILNQTFKDFEFIIVADNPNNSQVLKIINGYKKKDKRVIILVNEKNSGLAFSLNNAIRASKSEWIVRMDADDSCLTTRLENLWKNRKKADIIYTGVLTIDENYKIIKTPDDIERAYMRQVNAKSKEGYLTMMLEGDFITHPATMFNKKLGLYDSSFRRCEDYDMWVRAITKGFKIYYIDINLYMYLYAYKRYTLDSLKKIRISAKEELIILKRYRKGFKKVDLFKYYRKIWLKTFYYFVSIMLYPLLIFKNFIKRKSS